MSMHQPRNDPGGNPAPGFCSLRIRVGGRVQGVGFRPFVYRLARQLGVDGSVQNLGGEVQILATGTDDRMRAFLKALVDDAPAIARPFILAAEADHFPTHGEFEISQSAAGASAERHLPPDYFTCDACLAELTDPDNRRYRYPFINCTQCGPRYTLIRDLPYDRARTSMADFQLCPACRDEYEDPGNRRFHAEPVACPRCGPQLRYRAGAELITDPCEAFDAAAKALQRGDIVAVKGIGGYHLMCDARNEDAVRKLRSRKHRPHKPLAVLFPQTGADDLDVVRQYCAVDDRAGQALLDPTRPIVLLRRRSGDVELAPSLAPGLNELGAMLPYSPLHHLLTRNLSAPLVATSANLSGEPVLTAEDEVESRLADVADTFLHHDRPILRPADDSVVRSVAGRARTLRLGRGLAPLELRLEHAFPAPLLAVGGHMKNTIALGWERRIVVSPHIGDLDAPRSRSVFEAVITDLQQIYDVAPRYCIHDAHPDYASTRWVKSSGLQAVAVPHHRAHAAAVAGEYGHEYRWLVFTWDGTGLGEDDTLWGGEALMGRPGDWRRVASLRPFSLPGGDRAARQPWRAAAALAWEAGRRPPGTVPALVREAWERHVNCATSSAAGRLFDGAAAWLGLLPEASFEGQGPMYLESLATPGAEPVALTWARDHQGVWRCDWAPLLALLDDERQMPALRAGRFHASLAQAMAKLATRLRELHGDFAVGLGGGVFQNRLLAERTLDELTRNGLRAYLPAQIPCNDGGLSFGQLIEAGAMLAAASGGETRS